LIGMVFRHHPVIAKNQQIPPPERLPAGPVQPGYPSQGKENRFGKISRQFSVLSYQLSVIGFQFSAGR
jgi:hypothetical protein